MKKLIIICEGQTEQMFCDKILKPHFAAIDIVIDYPLISYSGGGIVKWRHLKTEIELYHSADSERFITTFIDYYGMYPYHLFPDWVNAHAIGDKPARMEILEKGMQNDLSAATRPFFIPNIQLHEFEALVFSDYTVFNSYYAPNEFANNGLIELARLCAISPESINDGLNTAPSKQLKTNIPVYDKVNDGAELALLIGLATIRGKCPRFNAWLSELEGI